ncbi:MAG: DUF5654 family protein [bacterium]
MKIEVIEKLAALITAAFGLVAALAWNDTIKLIFSKFFAESSTIIAMLIYAILVTIIAVLITILMGRISERVVKKNAVKKKTKKRVTKKK